MARKAYTEPDVLSQEAWEAQPKCPTCGGRPGYNPATGVNLLIKLPNGEWCAGHTYNCASREH